MSRMTYIAGAALAVALAPLAGVGQDGNPFADGGEGENPFAEVGVEVGTFFGGAAGRQAYIEAEPAQQLAAADAERAAQLAAEAAGRAAELAAELGLPRDVFRPAPQPPIKVRSPYAGRNPQDAQLRSHDRNLTQQIAALARQFKQTDSEAQRAKLREQITQCITAQFVLRQSLRALELAELEAQLGRLRAVHNRRTAEQERIVSDRVEQVMREAEGLGWGDGGEGGRGTDFGEPSPFPTVYTQPPGWNGETYSSPARAVIYPVPAPTNRFPPSVDPAADPVPVNPGPAPAPQPALAPGAPVAPAAPVRPSP